MKFSELTLDMFRMLQALEREPEEYQSYSFENSTDFANHQVRIYLSVFSRICSLGLAFRYFSVVLI